MVQCCTSKTISFAVTQQDPQAGLRYSVLPALTGFLVHDASVTPDTSDTLGEPLWEWALLHLRVPRYKHIKFKLS